MVDLILSKTLSKNSAEKDIQGTAKRNNNLPTESLGNFLTRSSTSLYLLHAAYQELFPGRSLEVLFNFNDGIYNEDREKIKITEEDIEKLRKWFASYFQDEKKEIKLYKMPRNDLKEYFKMRKLDEKLKILTLYRNDPVEVAQIGDYIDYVIEPISSNKKIVEHFQIMKIGEGLIIRFPLFSDPTKIKPYVETPHLYDFLKKYSKWQKDLKCKSIPEMNDHIMKGTINNIKWLSENLHNIQLFEVCNAIIKVFPQKRIITLAGPSSSNKTSVSLRIAMTLKTMGYDSIVISMDDYYKPLAEISKDEEGQYNFEDMDALNIKGLQQTLERLLKGQEVFKRKYNFDDKGGVETSEKMKLEGNQFIILEGILGLHTDFIKIIGKENIFRIFVHPYNMIQIDRDHLIKNSDGRLIRRIVRDYKFRGTRAEKNLGMWKKVRFSEETNIFPYQNDCDFLFNTSLIYELPVLGKYAKPLLLEIAESNENIILVNKLLFILFLLYPFDDERKVPGISFLREFIGDSDFDY